jgi:UDP-2,3-diacylglucosamine pyrophosphatase LpxH
MQKILFISVLYSIFLWTGCSIQGNYIRETANVSAPPIQTDSIIQTIYLIGDAGEPTDGGQEPVFRFLSDAVMSNPALSTIIFLGDNIYPSGLPDTNDTERKEMERRLFEQINIGAANGVRTIFIPGNHDWDYKGKQGLAAINRQEDFIIQRNLPNIFLTPTKGSPGPSVIDIGDDIRIIAIDTEWWLHKYAKPLYPNDTNEIQTRKKFLDSLSTILEESRQKRSLIVGHHPLRTFGEHGGFFDWKDHIFPLRKLSVWLWIPLPGIGSLYPISRMMGISDQDMSGAKNIIMRNAIDSVLAQQSVVAYASGHEHTLQVIDKESDHYYLVSGKGIQHHDEALTVGEATIAATRREGFMRLDYLKNGAIRLGVIVSGDASGVEVFSMMLR